MAVIKTSLPVDMDIFGSLKAYNLNDIHFIHHLHLTQLLF